jgi:hypothetical protein
MFVEGNVKHFFVTAGEVGGYGRGLIEWRLPAAHFNTKLMVSRRDLEGMKFVALRMMENPENSLVRSF